MGATKKLGEAVISTSRGGKLEGSGKSSVPMPLFPAKSVAVMTGRGIMQPSASAPLKSPEPTPKISVDSNKETFSSSRSFSDKNKYSRQSGLSGIDPNTEERIRDLEEVEDDLLSRAKERRSKTQEVKEDAMTRMGTDDPELNEFAIQNYRAGGAESDRASFQSRKPRKMMPRTSASKRTETFLSELNDSDVALTPFESDGDYVQGTPLMDPKV